MEKKEPIDFLAFGSAVFFPVLLISIPFANRSQISLLFSYQFLAPAIAIFLFSSLGVNIIKSLGHK